jgi:3-oxoacyl-[acyl-carrier protein] reductase
VDVAFTYRRGEEAAASVLAAAAGLPGTVLPIRHDLLDGDASALVTTALDQFGRLDGAVLSAGVWDGGRIGDLDPDAWWRVVETNLRGTYRIARESLPHLLGSSAGSVVLVSSAVALTGFPGDTAYASAKAAMLGFARSLAHEVGSAGVRVNVLAPGFVDTEMTSAISGSARERILRRTVLGRFATPEEIARPAVFLSEDATFTTGAVLTADGGWTL